MQPSMFNQNCYPFDSNSEAPVAGPSRSSSTTVNHQPIFDDFEAYPFSDDQQFKAGLPTVINAIRGIKRSAAQIDEMIGRAQWFYFTRLRGHDIPWEVYAQYSTRTSSRDISTPASNSPSGGPSSTGSRSATPLRPKDPLVAMNNLAEARKMMLSDNIPTPSGREGEGGMSFAMLCRLISDGRASEVPGIRDIPDQLNSQPASLPQLAPRPKPWEQQRISPPGTSARFNDPPLAPSPGAFEFGQYDDSTLNPSGITMGDYQPRKAHTPLEDIRAYVPSQSRPSTDLGPSPSQSFTSLSFGTFQGFQDDQPQLNSHLPHQQQYDLQLRQQPQQQPQQHQQQPPHPTQSQQQYQQYQQYQSYQHQSQYGGGSGA